MTWGLSMYCTGASLASHVDGFILAVRTMPSEGLPAVRLDHCPGVVLERVGDLRCCNLRNIVHA